MFKFFGALLIGAVLMTGGAVAANAQLYNTSDGSLPNNTNTDTFNQTTFDADETEKTDRTGETLGITTPGIPETGGTDRNALTNVLVVVFAALIAIWGGAYITRRLSTN